LEYQKLYLLQQSIDHSIKRKLNDKLLFKYLNLISKEKGIFTKKSAFLIRHPNFFMSYLKSKILCLLRECQ
ncbi:MAG: hypothetical protein R3321_11465, partial [Nitrososphaeraceae archaeon]|nr:hypothetical protein [Nitrososphaeraceae archaeon]